MQISMDIDTLNRFARDVHVAALRTMNWAHTRNSAARAFIAEADAAGLRGDDARWAANKCMSLSGYGGGI